MLSIEARFTPGLGLKKGEERTNLALYLSSPMFPKITHVPALPYLSVPISVSRLLSHPINCVEIIIGPYTGDWLLQEVHDPI